MFALLGLLCFALASANPVENLLSPQIGFALNNPFMRIIGGKPAAEKQFPYQVSLQYGSSLQSTSHFCGGVVIGKRWIMTAAHCPKAIPSYGVFVVKAGKIKLQSHEAHEQVIKVSRSYVHERYGGGVGPYDVAMLLLETPLDFTDYVQPINLPEAQSSHTGNVILSGWGSITPRYTIPNNLQYIELPLVDYETCKNSLNQLIGSSQNPLHQTNVCTGPLTGGKSPCAGDSGGPLVAMNPKTHQPEVVGIVSWGIVPCGTVGAPAVYTKTSAHSDWIALTMSNE